MTVREANQVLDRAAAAFPAWSQTTRAERRGLLDRAADLLEQRFPDVERLMIAEVGATPAWVRHNTTMDVHNLREVVAIVHARDADHALQIANHTEYGLSGSLFTRDVARALQLAARWETGQVHINGPTLGVESQTPYGGVEDSGYGRFGGTESIREFTSAQMVTINHDQHYPF